MSNHPNTHPTILGGDKQRFAEFFKDYPDKTRRNPYGIDDQDSAADGLRGPMGTRRLVFVLSPKALAEARKACFGIAEEEDVPVTSIRFGGIPHWVVTEVPFESQLVGILYPPTKLARALMELNTAETTLSWHDCYDEFEGVAKFIAKTNTIITTFAVWANGRLGQPGLVYTARFKMTPNGVVFVTVCKRSELHTCQ
jgi:hypothetical protein